MKATRLGTGSSTASVVRLVIGGLISSLFAAACGGATPAAKPVSVDSNRGLVSSAKGVGDSRCDVEGRSDRVRVLSQALGAEQGSIQRVYATGAVQEDGRRVVRCREVDTNLDGVKDLVRTFTDDGDPLMEQADSNYDGKVDTWVTFARGKVAHLEMDKNADGRPDEYRVYSQGVLSKVQRDSNHDGRLDTWEVYEQGRLNRIGTDRNGDEKVDRWYRDAELVHREQAEAEAEKSASEAPPAAEAEE
jgi:hypothetical protein